MKEVNDLRKAIEEANKGIGLGFVFNLLKNVLFQYLIF